MSVRKREWMTAKGEAKQAWVVDYKDGQAKRRLKTFTRKKAADDFSATASCEVREGVHVADSASATVRQAGALWLATLERDGLERSTVDQARQHLTFHILPFLGTMRLSRLSVPVVRDFEEGLASGDVDMAPPQRPRSPAMVRKVRASLGWLLADAQERGLVARNVVRDMRAHRRKGRDSQNEARKKPRLQVGVDIPTPREIKAIVGHAKAPWRAPLITVVFSGLRASELRGLPWRDVDLEKGLLHVRQRADRYNAIGQPKTDAGKRTVPLPPIVINTLREWRLVCPRPFTGECGPDGKLMREAPSSAHLVFPNGLGKVESLANIINRGLIPTQLAAGVAVDTGKRGDDGKPIMRAKYTGMHALRHFYASWCINRKVDGGLELPPKSVQVRLGHSSIVMTMDTYGHLFPQDDYGRELAEAERALLA